MAKPPFIHWWILIFPSEMEFCEWYLIFRQTQFNDVAVRNHGLYDTYINIIYIYIYYTVYIYIYIIQYIYIYVCVCMCVCVSIHQLPFYQVTLAFISKSYGR